MIEEQIIGESSANKEKYQEFQIKLDNSKKLETETSQLEALHVEAQGLYTALKTFEGPAFFRNVNTGVAVIGILAGISHMFVKGLVSLGIVILCLLAAVLLVNKILISRKIQESSRYKNVSLSEPIQKVELFQFLQYVQSGIELKVIRFFMLALILGIALSSLCLVVGDILFSTNGLLEVGMAILFGIVFVYALFVKDIFDLSKMKNIVNNMIANAK